MNIKAENLGYLELDMLCKAILFISENENFHTFLSTADEVTFGFDLKYHSAYIYDGNYYYYFSDTEAGDFE